MAVSLYMDVHIPRPITVALRIREVDVITAQEDGAGTLSDPELLDRATSLQRVLFTYDNDFLAEATLRQRNGIPFAGVVFTHPQRLSTGDCVDYLELIAKTEEPEDMANRVQFLPL